MARFLEIRRQLVAGVNDGFADHGVTAYVDIPNRLKFPAFYPQPAGPLINYNPGHGMDNSMDATYRFDGYVLLQVGKHHPDDAQEVLDTLLSPDEPFIQALNARDVIAPYGRLWTEEVSDYGDAEVGSNKVVCFAARIGLRAEA